MTRLPLALSLALVALATAACAPARAAELVVRFKDAAPAAGVARAAERAGLDDPRPATGGATLLRVRDGVDPRAALRAIQAASSVAWAGPNYPARAADVVPNDTGVATTAAAPGGWQQAQWDLVGPFGIDVSPAWDLARAAGAEGGRGVRVAVLDTGVAYANRGRYRRSPELPPSRLLRGYDFVAHDDFPNDANGHGTFVASTIAGAANNGFGMVGIAYRADIMPVRVLGADGEGSSLRIAQGIRWAVDHGAQVINVSIELYDPLALHALSITTAPEIRSALRYAHDHRVVVVAAAGNAAQTDVPSRRLGADVIYVGGTTENGCLGDYSNRGPGIDLVAPGGGTDATLHDDPNCVSGRAGRSVLQVTFRKRDPASFFVPGSYKGTSMAAPHVTGAIALLLATGVLGPHPTPGTVQRRLAATARDLGAPGRDRRYGSGLLDVAAALRGTPATPTTSG
jgi:serine protease